MVWHDLVGVVVFYVMCVCARVCVRVCVFSTGVVVGRYGGSSGLLHHLCVVSLGVVS